MIDSYEFGRIVIDGQAKMIEENGIRLLAEPTEQACRQYNELVESASVVAALHLTC